MMLGSCAGIYVGLPVGPVQVGTSVTPDGDVDVHAGVSTPAGGVGVSGRVPKQQGPFTEMPAEGKAESQDERQKE